MTFGLPSTRFPSSWRLLEPIRKVAKRSVVEGAMWGWLASSRQSRILSRTSCLCIYLCTGGCVRLCLCFFSVTRASSNKLRHSLRLNKRGIHPPTYFTYDLTCPVLIGRQTLAAGHRLAQLQPHHRAISSAPAVRVLRATCLQVPLQTMALLPPT